MLSTVVDNSAQGPGVEGHGEPSRLMGSDKRCLIDLNSEGINVPSVPFVRRPAESGLVSAGSVRDRKLAQPGSWPQPRAHIEDALTWLGRISRLRGF